MLRVVGLAMSAVLISACATVNRHTIDAKAITTLTDQTVTYTIRKKPDFAAETAGKAVFGLLGAFAMISEGNNIIASNNVPDPAEKIAVGLIKALEETHGTRLITPPISTSEDNPAEIAASANRKARFVIDVQTINWYFGYFSSDWSHYRVIYVAKARVIDTKSNAVVAEGHCKRVPETNATAPTYDKLLANEASLLKEELSAAADECVKSLKAEMLSLD